MKAGPWKDWIPGVLAKKQMLQLIQEGLIGNITDPEIDASSMDLTLDGDGWELVKGSVKPTGDRYWHFLDKDGLCAPLNAEADGSFRLQAKKTYLFRIRERLTAPKLADARIYGQATAKSSIGRMDVLARLIVDGMNGYEHFSPDGLVTGTGEMFLEITPITFNVIVKPGISLSQLRFFFANPDIVEMSGPELYTALLRGSPKPDGTLSVDLTNTVIGNHNLVAFAANDSDNKNGPWMPLWKHNPESELPDPCQHWRFLKADENRRLEITKGAFYILRSKERIQLPKGVAVYCRAIDETIGEMRIHYAGFVHPWFGMKRDDKQDGTQLIFEVRGHDVNVSLVDGERMAHLTFYRMSEDAAEEDGQTEYGNQILQLSKLFRPWPEKIQVDKDGKVTPA